VMKYSQLNAPKKPHNSQAIFEKKKLKPVEFSRSGKSPETGRKCRL